MHSIFFYKFYSIIAEHRQLTTSVPAVTQDW